MSAYEKERLHKRYKNVSSRQKYTVEEFDAAYKAWVTAELPTRQIRWDAYCDVRDGVPFGTNHKITIGEIKSATVDLELVY